MKCSLKKNLLSEIFVGGAICWNPLRFTITFIDSFRIVNNEITQQIVRMFPTANCLISHFIWVEMRNRSASWIEAIKSV